MYAEISEKQLRSTEEIGEKRRRLGEVINKCPFRRNNEISRAAFLIGKSDNLVDLFYSIPADEKTY